MNKTLFGILMFVLMISLIIFVLFVALKAVNYFGGYDRAEEYCESMGRYFNRFLFKDVKYTECCKMKQEGNTYEEDCNLFKEAKQ